MSGATAVVRTPERIRSGFKVQLLYRDSLVLLDLLVPLGPMEKRRVPEHEQAEL